MTCASNIVMTGEEQIYYERTTLRPTYFFAVFTCTICTATDKENFFLHKTRAALTMKLSGHVMVPHRRSNFRRNRCALLCYDNILRYDVMDIF